MTISEIIKQGLHHARTSRSLWLFGFIVSLASGGSSGGGNKSGYSIGAGGLAISGGLPFGFPVWVAAFVITTIVVVAVTGIVMRYISEGALIEGVVRARQGGRMTTREAFMAGWTHFGVLLRIALLYIGATFGSLVLLAAPCVIAFRAFGVVGAVALGIPALVVAVPWLITLYLIQAFASRIAVIENRRAFDAIAKARLFLHGRLLLGLKLVVASFVGTFVMLLLGFAAFVPMALILFALTFVMHVVAVIVFGCVTLLPAIYIFAAMVGTFRSSIWTVGYVTEVEA